MNGFFRSLGPTLMAISGWAAEPLFSLPSTPAPPPAAPATPRKRSSPGT